VSGSDKSRRCEVQVSNRALAWRACLVGRQGQIGTGGNTSDKRSRPEDRRRGRRGWDGRGEWQESIDMAIGVGRGCTMHWGELRGVGVSERDVCRPCAGQSD